MLPARRRRAAECASNLGRPGRGRFRRGNCVLWQRDGQGGSAASPHRQGGSASRPANRRNVALGSLGSSGVVELGLLLGEMRELRRRWELTMGRGCRETDAQFARRVIGSSLAVRVGSCGLIKPTSN